MRIRKTGSFTLVLLIIGWLTYKPMLRVWHRAPVEIYIEGWQVIQGEIVARIRIENNTPRLIQYHLLLEPPHLVEHIQETLAQSEKSIACLTGLMPRMPYGMLAPGEVILVLVPVWWLNTETTNRPGLLISDAESERVVWGDGFALPWWVLFW